jgi:long-chain acyl-CoA synthetase
VDMTPYLDLKIAPRAVFDTLSERKRRIRFMILTEDGQRWRAVTWGAFAAQIRSAALFLQTASLASGERAAIFAPNRVEWIAAALAIQAAGGVMVPIYAANTVAQAAYVARHCDAKVIFVDTPALLGRVFEAWDDYAAATKVVLLDAALDAEAVLEKLAAAGKKVPTYAEAQRKLLTWPEAQAIGAARDLDDPGLFERTMSAVTLDQAAVMLYTSGTSGNPKGVPLTHRNIAVNGRDWLESNASLIDEDAVDLLWLPMSHIFGFGEACFGNTLGFTTYLCDPGSAIDRLPEVRPSVFMSVPSVWEKLATRAQNPDPAAQKARLLALTGGKLRFCLSGGAGLQRSVKELFHACGLLIIEGYGLTETSPTLTLNRPEAFRFDTVGKPFPSVEVKLAEDGEILARGPSVFGGYHKDPDATREAFTEDGWFKTGDVGRFTDDGFLQIIDRKKDILVTAGGKNVPPANIEVRFQDDPFIAHLVVFGDAKRYLTAGVWIEESAVRARLAEAGTPPESYQAAVIALVQERVDRVNAELPGYETIKRFRIFDEPLTVAGGLLTPTLKVRRKKVYERFLDAFEALYS